VLLVAFGAARTLLAVPLDTATWRLRIAVHYDITRATVDRLHALPLSYHRREGVGAIMTKMERGINGGIAAFSDVAFALAPQVFYLVIALVAMFRLEPRLTLVVIAFLPIPPIVGARAATEQSARERALIKRWTKIFSRFNEVLSGILVVKSFAVEDVEKRRFLRDTRAANDVVIDGVARDARTTALKQGAMALSRIAALGLGAWFVARGEVTVGTLVAFVTYTGVLFGPVQGVTNVYQTYRRGLVALETVFSILDAPDVVVDAPDALVARGLRGDVELAHVDFGYRRGHLVLRDVSLRASRRTRWPRR